MHNVMPKVSCLPLYELATVRHLYSNARPTKHEPIHNGQHKLQEAEAKGGAGQRLETLQEADMQQTTAVPYRAYLRCTVQQSTTGTTTQP